MTPVKSFSDPEVITPTYLDRVKTLIEGWILLNCDVPTSYLQKNFRAELIFFPIDVSKKVTMCNIYTTPPQKGLEFPGYKGWGVGGGGKGGSIRPKM